MSDIATHVIRYKRVPANGEGWGWIKRYEVHFDGQMIGTVGTKMVSHEHGRVGRIVGYRTQSPRWFTEDANGRSHPRLWNETRKGAVRMLVRDWVDIHVSPSKRETLHVSALVDDARDYRKTELRALEIAEIDKLDDGPEGTGANCDYRCAECGGPCDLDGRETSTCDCPCHVDDDKEG